MTKKAITYQGKEYASYNELAQAINVPYYKIKNWVNNGCKSKTITPTPQGKTWYGKRNQMYQIGTLDNVHNKVCHYQECVLLDDTPNLSNERMQREIATIIKKINSNYNIGVANFIVVVEVKKKMLSWEIDFLQDGRYTKLKDFAVHIYDKMRPAVKKYIKNLTKCQFGTQIDTTP